jgi:hypothetical protein
MGASTATLYVAVSAASLVLGVSQTITPYQPITPLFWINPPEIESVKPIPNTYIDVVRLLLIMPVTFGSVGDIISICLLVKDLVEALDKSQGSSAEYSQTISQLRVFERALLETHLLLQTPEPTAELSALFETARQTVEDCGLRIQAFRNKLRKYKLHLQDGGSSNFVKDAARKVQWQVSQKDETEKFRAEISAYTESINMLLTTSSVYVTNLPDPYYNNTDFNGSQETYET